MTYYQRCIQVACIPDGVSAVELTTFFESAGEVETILFRKDTSGKLSGSVFVVYKDPTSVGKSVADLSTKQLKGLTLTLRSVADSSESEINTLMSSGNTPLLKQLQSLPKDQLDQLLSHLGTPTVTPTSTPPTFSLSPVQQPKLPQFSGDNQRGDVSYTQWRYHLRAVLQSGMASPSIVMQTIRMSVKGTAADVLMYMGESTNPTEVIKKFDTIFGNALSSEQLYQQFYTAKQGPEESVISWSCRLQQLLTQVQEIDTMESHEADRKLRSTFFFGLRNEKIVAATRHRFDNGEPYDQLLAAVRKAEFEYSQKKLATEEVTESKKKATVHQQVTSNSIDAKLDKIMSMLTTMDRRVTSLEKSNKELCSWKDSSHASSDQQTRCQRCHRKNHETSECYATHDVRGKRLN